MIGVRPSRKMCHNLSTMERILCRWFGLGRTLGLMGLAIGLLLVATGCRRHQPMTEEDLQKAISERQQATQADIERTVSASPPPTIIVEQPAEGESGQGAPGSSPEGGTEFSTPTPTPARERPSALTPPPPEKTTRELGDIQLDPRTGEYGIRPPGAPENYTIPLNSPQSAPSGQQDASSP